MELREGGVEGVVSEVTGIQYESTPCDTVSEWTLDIGNCGAVEESDSVIVGGCDSGRVRV